MDTTAILTLLREIAANTKSNVALWSGLFPVLAALVVAISSYLIAHRNTKIELEKFQKTFELELKKLKSGIVTTERLRWLKELHDLGASFLSSLDFQYNLLKRPIDPKVDPTYQEKLDKLSD